MNYISNLTASLDKKFPTQMMFFYGLMSQFLFTVADYLSREQESRHSSSQVIYLFAFQIFLYNYFILQQQNTPLKINKPRETKLILLRCFSVLVYASTMYYAFPMLSYSEGIVLVNTSPALSGLLAVFILNEAYTLPLIINTVINFGGVILIAKPSWLFLQEESDQYPLRTEGIMFMLFTSAFVAINSVLMKKLSFSVNPALMACMLGLVLTVANGLIQIFMDVSEVTWFDWGVMISVGLMEAIGQMIYGKAFKFGQTLTVSLMGYSKIVYSYGLEIFFDGLRPDVYSIIGSIMIFCSLFVLIYQNR